ncbi:thiamine phosphate synthase [Sporolactobacillus sp. KGMB 08714]|uniref:thiamine phosphate synthase n=1 Tax=Sporolactobacillus sp. KGMB 08714 TaxID=3064704 RepID=UPI002FBDBEAE
MTKEREALRRALSLYFIMGSQDGCGEDPLKTINLALEAGVTCFQWREKGPRSLKGQERIDFAKNALNLCRSYHVPFFVDDDVNLAVRLQADGVHIGQKDGSARAVRREIGGKMWLGVSAHSFEEAERAREQGADYIGVGPYKPTQSKPDAESPIGTALIRRLGAARYPLPIVAIGGITPADVPAILSAGADGVAVISVISRSPDPQSIVRQFLNCLNR